MATSEENLKNPDKNEESSSSSSCLKNPKILIAIIAGAVVVIVVVIVLAVVLTKDDDSSSSVVDSDDDIDISNIGDERWVDAYNKAKNFLKSFSYEEKYLLLYGDYNVSKTCVGGISPIPDRGFPGICLQDGPAGVRPSNYATTWQAAINSAATFNRDLVYEVGKAQGGEFKAKGVNIMLTPCINIMKHPKGGRIWESYGEDPFLLENKVLKLLKECKALVLWLVQNILLVMNMKLIEEIHLLIFLKKLYLKFILNLFIKQLKKEMLLPLWNLIMQLMVHL